MTFERSYLFVPGDRPERFSKALATGADRIVLDLEDAVQPGSKDVARESVARWICEHEEAIRSRMVVRINGTDSAWHSDDVVALEAVSGISAVMLPKCENDEMVDAVHHRLDVPVVLLIETVAGLVHLRQIAACNGVARIAFGSVDFCSDAGIEGDQEELDYARSKLVIESRFAGLAQPIDGVTLNLGDDEFVRRDLARARRFGFGAKLCIHPKQVSAVNAGFSPTSDELAWAKRVLEACDNAAGLGAFSVDGKLVDKPILDRARRLIGTASHFRFS